jgi:hypothetical protein
VSEIVCYIKINIGKLEQNAEIHDHNTRQNSDLCIQFCRISFFKKRVVDIGIKLYNKLLNQMKKVEKMKYFKRELRSFLLQHTFYSINEYMHH